MPGSNTISANNTYAVDQLTLQDANGTVDISQFYGGTILTILMSMVTQATPDFASPIAGTGYSTDHHGIFLTPVNDGGTPSQTIWSPNVPSGDFMIRWSSEFHMIVHSTPSQAQAVYSQETYPLANIVTRVRRRIRENDNLWVAHYHFEDASIVEQTNYGWTGRILIQLP